MNVKYRSSILFLLSVLSLTARTTLANESSCGHIRFLSTEDISWLKIQKVETPPTSYSNWWFRVSHCNMTSTQLCTTHLHHPSSLLAVHLQCNVKRKVKVTLVQALKLCTGRMAHRGSRGTALPFLDQRLKKGVRGQCHALAALYPLGKTWYPLYSRLGGPQGRSGQVRKISPPPGFDPRTVQSVASRYNNYGTQPTLQCDQYIITCTVPLTSLPFKVY
jgi:hypothetical protein